MHIHNLGLGQGQSEQLRNCSNHVTFLGRASTAGAFWNNPQRPKLRLTPKLFPWKMPHAGSAFFHRSPILASLESCKGQQGLGRLGRNAVGTCGSQGQTDYTSLQSSWGPAAELIVKFKTRGSKNAARALMTIILRRPSSW